MHILGIILAIFGAIAVWSWRLQQAKRGAEEAIDLAKTAANLPRRLKFKYQYGKGGVDLIDDPREAAAILAMEVACARGGPLTKAQSSVMESEFSSVLQCSVQEAEELSAHAAWVTNDAPSPEQVMRKLSKMIVGSLVLGPKEVVDLDGLLVAVSEADGQPTRDQLRLIQIYRDVAGLVT